MKKLYDSLICECHSLIPAEVKALSITDQVKWKEVKEQNMILKRDMAYELGGGTNEAVSGLFFTSDQSLVEEDEILLYGPDLSEITEDIPYARLTFVRVEENSFGESDEAYRKLRDIEYARYHVKPKGYMMRISVANDREPVRIGKAELEAGLDFSKVGNLLLKEYKKRADVKAVKMIFITKKEFPYRELAKIVKKSELITESLNSIFQNLKMDCTVCGLKPVCDEVEGMREMHFKQQSEQEKKGNA